MPATPEILLPASERTIGSPLDDAEVDRAEQRLAMFATALDAAFRIPGTQIRFGADAILGLVPVLGDGVGMALSAYLILEARRLGASPALLARMIGNVALDTVFGSIPLVGSVFDVFYKANMRNLALLRDHLADIRSRRPRTINPAWKSGDSR